MISIEAQTTTSGEIIEDVYSRITLINRDPYPADPGGYVTLLFKIENLEQKEQKTLK